MFQTHYRQQLDLTDEGLAAAQEASRRLGEFQNRLLQAKSNSDQPRLSQAAERLARDVAEGLNDDLNAPRAVAAMFTFMNEANAALDTGERAGPAALQAWANAEGILGVTSRVTVMKVKAGGTGASTEQEELSESPPADPTAAEGWARNWAMRRAQSKSARDYAEADRIRALLGQHGFQVRDSRDGSIEVVRTAVPKT
jgi:cysteinyl-tRNA synthetase